MSDESRAYEVKAELVTLMTDQQRALGLVPNSRAAEEYIQAERVVERAFDGIGAPCKIATPGAEKGALTPMGRHRGIDPRGNTLSKREATNSEIARLTHAGESSDKRKLREHIKRLGRMPEWKEQIKNTMLMHACFNDRGQFTLDDVGKMKILAMYEQSVKALGDPLARKDPRIQVG